MIKLFILTFAIFIMAAMYFATEDPSIPYDVRVLLMGFVIIGEILFVWLASIYDKLRAQEKTSRPRVDNSTLERDLQTLIDLQRNLPPALPPK